MTSEKVSFSRKDSQTTTAPKTQNSMSCAILPIIFAMSAQYLSLQSTGICLSLDCQCVY